LLLLLLSLLLVVSIDVAADSAAAAVAIIRRISHAFGSTTRVQGGFSNEAYSLFAVEVVVFIAIPCFSIVTLISIHGTKRFHN
jgi:hypothetical protein